MPKKIKSQIKGIQVAPTAKKKTTSHKKVISCHCWPGVYEAAQRIMNEYAHDKLNDEKLSMSEFINIIISDTHFQVFGQLPDFRNENTNNSKGEI